MRPLPPGFISRIAAMLMGAALAVMLLDDLAERLAAPPEELPVARSGVAPASPVIAESAAEPAAFDEDPVASAPADETPPRPTESAPSGAPTPDPEPMPLAAPPATVVVAAPPRPATVPAPEVPPGAEPPPAPVGAGERCLRVVELFDSEETAGARAAAAAVLDDFPSPADLTGALADEGVSPHRARLWTLLVLHLAGEEEEARQQARLARASHPGNREVEVSLRRWNILRPRIVEVSSYLDEDRQLVLKGTVKNEDVGFVRKVKVRGEALDDSGNVVAASETRVKPKRIAANLAGEFEIQFKDIVDHERIARTRATVVQYEYEVAGR